MSNTTAVTPAAPPVVPMVPPIRPTATTRSGHRHIKVPLPVQRGNGHEGGKNGATASPPAVSSQVMYGTTLRYRTDLDKAVIHFMFERLLRPVEEIVIPGGHSEDPDKENTAVGDWHFFWMSVSRIRTVLSTADFRLHDNQIINHFPNHYELTRKDLMYKNIKRYLREHAGTGPKSKLLTLATATDWVSAAANMQAPSSTNNSAVSSATRGLAPAAAAAAASQRTGGKRYYCFADGVPITYNIPNDMSMFAEEFKRHPGATWIVKPTARSQGKGIFLINRIQQLNKWMKEKREVESGSLKSPTSPSVGLSLSSPAAGPMSLSPSASQQLGKSTSASNVTPAVDDKKAKTTDDSGNIAAAGDSTGSGSNKENRGDEKGGAATPASKDSSPVADGATPPPAAAVTTAPTKEKDAKDKEKDLLGTFIVSRYIANPLLIGGKKFDLRLYVLVTSYKPLVAYLHEGGFARFCATKYAGESLAEDDLGSHLTNVALQKGDDNYNTTHGGKWSLKNLSLYIQGRYGAYVAEGLMSNIEFLIYHSLKAMEVAMFNDKHSFELYGYDILIDDNIAPHLIEVNASPSLSSTTTSDRLLKEEVLSDMLKVVLPPGFPTSKAMPYWEWRTRTDLTTQLRTGFKLLEF